MLAFALFACATPEEPCAGCAADTGGDTDTDTSPSVGSAGCGKAVDLAPGGVQITLDAGADGGGERGYWLSLPENYDPDHAYAVVLGYPGTNWVGEQIQPYLDLERYGAGDYLYAYPDPQWHDFTGWGTYGGWLLGPHAAPADGMADLVFTTAILDQLEAEYCVDTARVFVTGHSWGGDMAAVVGCFLGDRVTATAPVAANEPYWFDGGADFACAGNPAVWTWFGVADDHFTWQSYAGEFGDMQDAFWAEAHACAEETTPVEVGPEDDCVAHTGCSADTRYCLYGPDTEHQAPAGYAQATMAWFGGF